MRTTMHTIHQNTLANLNRITTSLNLLNAQISSGKIMSKPSDDPVNLVGALGLRSSLAQIKQYQRNLVFGTSLTTASESALRQIKELGDRAKEVGIQAVNGVVTPENRANMAEEVRNLFEQAIVLANTQVDGKFIFGGYRTTGYNDAEPAPFVADLDDGYRVNGDTLTGVALNAGDLSINGIEIGAAAPDGVSSINADRSAAAMAKAVNDLTGQTGVTAEVTAATHTGAGGVAAGTIISGDLQINGVDIFPVAVLDNDADNALVDAINAKQNDTGVVASRNSSGQLILTAVGGRNLEISTTPAGQTITGLATGVYYGSLQLHSDRIFRVETVSTTDTELTALGLNGGNFQSDDAGGDGTLVVHDLAKREGYVRYTGDRENDIDIAVGPRSTLTISKNGQEALKDTGVFTVLKNLENYLRGGNYHEAQSANAASDTTVAIGTGGTGLAGETQVTAGSFTVTVTDHEQSPAQDEVISIPVDPANDSLEDIAARLDNLPNLDASWNADGYLEVKTTDPDRFSFKLSSDNSNFLEAAGMTNEDIQIDSIENSIGELGPLMDKLADQISDFGARGNRIDAQNQIMDNLEVATTENLSAKEDTDMLEAISSLKEKETAYQAALMAASKTMQLSLVNYL